MTSLWSKVTKNLCWGTDLNKKLKGGKLMEDLINDSIIESISEEYQIYKMTVDDLEE